MKLTAYILLKDNSIIRKTVKNPSSQFEVSYNVDGNKESFTYKFDKTKKYSMKKFIGTSHISFYEHASMQPLDAKFHSKDNIIKELNAVAESKLVAQLVDSTKNKGAQMGVGLVLGLAGILALVLIVIFG